MASKEYTAQEMREMADAIINECVDEEAGLVYESPAKAGHIFYPDEAAAMLRQAAEMRKRCEVLFEYIRKGCPQEVAEFMPAMRKALTLPLRNCDVGTPEEQAERYEKLCDSHTCGSRCSGSNCPLYDYDCSPFAWAQMSYEEEAER